MFYSNSERKNYKALTFNIVHFANFEIRAPKFKRCRWSLFLFIYLLYLTLVYKIVENNSTNKYQQNQVKI